MGTAAPRCLAVMLLALVAACPEAADRPDADADDCHDTCELALCGDGLVNAAAGEVCDDGNAADGDGCSSTCDSDESCGNGIVDTRLPYTRVNMPSSCLDAEAHGTNCAEVCDDGNTVSGDGCSRNCLSEEVCGNGIRDPLGNPTGSPPQVPELCDDGNDVDVDECPNSCTSGGGVRPRLHPAGVRLVPAAVVSGRTATARRARRRPGRRGRPAR